MPQSRLSVLRRPTLRENITAAVAAAGLIAVATSSVVSVANNDDGSRVAMVAEQQADAEPVSDSIPAPAKAPVLPGLPSMPTPAAAAPAPIPAPAPEAAPAPAAPTYANNLDGWIREALDIMHEKGIPGSYEGIMRNIQRESTGDPKAINLWDSNAIAGIPSKGLLQVIDPTFNSYHVEGTSHDVWDPVANIAAACNYAAHRYGSMDNVDSAY
ncbi:transglycosylase SLT domain-containing protein [Nocardia callitridis]|uniref:Transglycosylase SLT domain-containing protein n=1 Tax=Nocardia callitridis TaxID=648753 RepID=A0ABP9KV56_9NOCA